MRPNILFIVLDTLRADAIEPYGAPRASSPALADLARAGTVVHGARATAPWTLPSHASMFTGALPRGLGLGQSPGATPTSAAERVRALRQRSLPAVLKVAGYTTRAISTNLWVSPYSGFDTGFDEFEFINAGRQARLDGGRRDALAWTVEATRAGVDDGASKAIQVLERWVDERQPGPWLWFVNLLECHSPYLPPRPYNSLSLPERLIAAVEARRYLTMTQVWRACLGQLEVPAPALDRMRRLYAGAARYVDRWVERAVVSLDQAGMLDETLLIITSDHGENLGDGGLMCHALSLDDRLLRVPLIARGPRASELEGLISLAELPRRIASIAGLEEHPWHQQSCPGAAAIAQWDPPAPPSHPRVQRLVADWGAGQEVAERLGMRLTSATRGRFKLLRRNDTEELIDLRSDPLELDPIRHEGAMRNRAGDELIVLRSALDDPLAEADAPAPTPSTTPAPDDEVAELERSMRLLGYM